MEFLLGTHQLKIIIVDNLIHHKGNGVFTAGNCFLRVCIFRFQSLTPLEAAVCICSDLFILSTDIMAALCP